MVNFVIFLFADVDVAKALSCLEIIRAEMDDEAWAILNHKKLLVPGEEGLRDIRIVEAICKSAENDGQGIKL
jgi:hypothetical protein